MNRPSPLDQLLAGVSLTKYIDSVVAPMFRRIGPARPPAPLRLTLSVIRLPNVFGDRPKVDARMLS